MLRATDLSIARGDRVLHENFSLEVQAGEILHLHGPNGAGKTSVLEVLAGLRPPVGGQVVAPEPSQIHWIGHQAGFSLGLNALENLGFWCGLQGLAETGIAPALQSLGMYRLRYRPLRQLSAGQRRRVALARLLLQERPLWLLDEPLAALDHAGIEQLQVLLAEHAAKDGAVVLSSHQRLSSDLAGLRVMELSPCR